MPSESALLDFDGLTLECSYAMEELPEYESREPRMIAMERIAGLERPLDYRASVLFNFLQARELSDGAAGLF